MNVCDEIDEILSYICCDNIEEDIDEIELGIDRWAEFMRKYGMNTNSTHFSVLTYTHMYGTSIIVPNKKIPKHQVSINNTTLLDIVVERELLGVDLNSET